MIPKRYSRVLSERPITATIVGGGIGGLACALALAKAGIKCTVLEQQGANEDEGAGIQLSPNATRILIALGLESELSAHGRVPERMEWRDGKSDEFIAHFKLGSDIEEQFSAPYLQFSRPNLCQILEEACNKTNGIHIRHSEKVHGLAFTSSGVDVQSSSGEHKADLCIGADGTHSYVRTKSNLAPKRLRFGGYAFRAIIASHRLDWQYPQDQTTVWLHHAVHVVTYAIGSDGMLNCVFVVDGEDVPNDGDIHRIPATKSELLVAMKDCGDQVVSLAECAAESSLFKWPLYQFIAEERTSRTKEPLALIGDAWHTTFPFAAQGAGLAVEDAACIANCLSNASSTEIADRLVRFKALRSPRIREVQRISARNRFVYHVRNPLLRKMREIVSQSAFKLTSNRLFSYIDKSNK